MDSNSGRPISGSSTARGSAAAALDKQRFPPGTLIASRYRIISLLGKGGMGEVFRADDLILGQQVALKFLPEQATANANLLTRFYDEVRIARQVTHANVCRVYDIGEIQGAPYLSMEYIDGEDLGSLLRRIGRLPADKAVEFSRKLCAGLAAAHAQGVLHRDLKPGNIMIDARGQVRIMDFGLAGLIEHLQGAEIRNGTPAYMAPEQLTGKEVSVQSDVYALGLVMYEMFTGKAPFEASTAKEMLKLRQETKVTTPSSLVHDMEPDVERAILQCLEADPRKRPPTAMALAAALPGGDALSAALAAGETPSPQLVAAAGTNEGLRPRIAIAALAGIAVCMAALFVIKPRMETYSYVPLENPPEVLAAKAHDLVRKLGYPEKPADTAYGFADLNGYRAYMEPRISKAVEWRQVLASRPSPLLFWYRQSPRPLETSSIYTSARADLADPFPAISGMAEVMFDTDGRVVKFQAIPPQRETASADSPPVDWAPLFAAADLDITKFQRADPEWTPLAPIDSRSAWTGTYPGNEIPVRIEAASWRGLAVYFDVIWPWRHPSRMLGPPETAAQRLSALVSNFLFLGVVIGAIVMAWHNWRMERIDTRGSVRVGVFAFVVNILVWLFGAHHVATAAEQKIFNQALADGLLYSGVLALLYLALEPWVRRYWPQTLITWTRVLDGRLRDPLVGRDLLFGILFGMAYCVLVAGYEAALLYAGNGPSSDFTVSNFLGARWITWKILATLLSSFTSGPSYFFAIFLLRSLLRKQWLAAVAFVALWATSKVLGSGNILISAIFWVLIYGLLVMILMRFGLFATVVMLFVIDSFVSLLGTPDFMAWYGLASLALLVLLAGMAIIGFRLSLGGQKLINDPV